VLGLDLIVQGSRLRFYHGTARVLANDEIIHKLEETVEELAFGREAAEQRAEAERLRAEAERTRADAAEQRVAELLAEFERLRALTFPFTPAAPPPRPLRRSPPAAPR